MKNLVIALLLLSMLTACVSGNSPKYQLSDHHYQYRQRGSDYRKAYVYVAQDSVKIYDTEAGDSEIIPTAGADQFFLKRSFDVDVMTVLFKYRPGSSYLPRQLLTDFNGNVFMGYRLDRFRIRHTKTPFGYKPVTTHRAITLGAFTGIGSTAVTPWTTSNQTTDEYNGLVISRGLAVMVGLNTLTVGVGIGWDALTDRDRHIWIYQNKPWYGVTLGLNLN